jgi:hypothetical protein
LEKLLSLFECGDRGGIPQPRSSSPAQWHWKWFSEETIVYDAWPEDHSSDLCGQCVERTVARFSDPAMAWSKEALLLWRDAGRPKPRLPPPSASGHADSLLDSLSSPLALGGSAQLRGGVAVGGDPAAAAGAAATAAEAATTTEAATATAAEATEPAAAEPAAAKLAEASGCPDSFQPVVIVRTEVRELSALAELALNLFTQRGVGGSGVAVVLLTHDRDTHRAFAAFQDWWAERDQGVLLKGGGGGGGWGVGGRGDMGGEPEGAGGGAAEDAGVTAAFRRLDQQLTQAQYRNCSVHVPPFEDLLGDRLSNTPARQLSKDWLDEDDLEHPLYLEFHYHLYLLTDWAVEWALRRVPGASHVLVTNGDNLYSLDFLRHTCRRTEDLVGTGIAHNGWKVRATGGVGG